MYERIGFYHVHTNTWMHTFIHTDEVQEYRHAYVKFRLKNSLQLP